MTQISQIVFFRVTSDFFRFSVNRKSGVARYCIGFGGIFGGFFRLKIIFGFSVCQNHGFKG